MGRGHGHGGGGPVVSMIFSHANDPSLNAVKV